MLKIQALVSRVSTDMQREKGLPISRQKKWLDEEGRRLKFKNPIHYTDNGYSATDLNRPRYSHLIQDIKAGLVDTVLVYKYDRIARNLKDLLNFIELCSQYGVNFISISEKFDTTTPLGKVMMNFSGSMAQFERDNTIERVKDAMWEMAKAGKFCGGQPPYGYDVSNKNLIPNTEESKIISLIFDKFIEIKSFRGVVQWLNEKGYTTKRGTSFAQPTIRRVLTNPNYKGYFTYGKRANNSKKFLPKEGWITVKGNFEPLITEELFDRVQLIVRQRDYVKPERTGEIFILSGLLKCGVCGGSMCGAYAINPQGKRYNYYKCHNHQSKGNAICKGNSVRQDYIEEQVLEEVSNYAIQFEENETKNILTKQNKTDELKRIETNIRNIEQRRQKLLSLFEDGSIAKDLLVKRMDDLETGLDRAKLQKDKLLIELGCGSRDKLVDVLERVNQLNGKFKTLPRATQKEILRQLVKESRYYKTGEIEIEKYEL
jgi:site-specific DNA recombinase